MKTLKEALAKIAELEKRIEELEARLRIYENPHVPSSKRIIREEKVVESTPKKRGAPEGHKGATRETPVPNMIVKLKPKGCICGSEDIEILKAHKRIVEDVQITKIVREYHFYDCRCKKCHNEFTTSDAGLPREGKFGPNITALWENLHYIGTIPFDRLSKISENCFGISITPAGLHNATYRTAEIFRPTFERIERRVRKAKSVGSDETGQSFNGEKWWLWNLSTEKDVLVLLRDSRGSKVLKEIFGDFFDGILSSDCFSAYSKFKAREKQKCWSHILRDAEDIAKRSEEGKILYNMLSRMYDYIKKVKEEKRENAPAVKAWIRRAKKEIMLWVDRNWESKALVNLILRIAKYKNDWFTCLKHSFVQPTINEQEREIRKNVIARKISGLHRSNLGMRSREVMMSTILTLQKRGENPFAFVQNGVANHNLGLGPPPIS